MNSFGDIQKGEKAMMSSSTTTLKLPKTLKKTKKDLNPDEKFQNLVGMINAAKKATSKGTNKNSIFAPTVHDLVDEWRSMSNRK